MVLVGLAETNWGHVPAYLRDELLCFAGGFCTTKLVEDVFHVLRAAEQKTQSGGLSRQSRYLACVLSDILVDGDRPRVDLPNDVPRSVPPVTPADYCAEGAWECSIPADELASLCSPSPTWRSPNTENYSHVPLMLQSLLHHAGTGFRQIHKR